MAKIFTLKTMFNKRQKRMVAGEWFGTSKGCKATHGMEEQKSGKQKFVGPGRDSETLGGILANRLC